MHYTNYHHKYTTLHHPPPKKKDCVFDLRLAKVCPTFRYLSTSVERSLGGLPASFVFTFIALEQPDLGPRLLARGWFATLLVSSRPA